MPRAVALTGWAGHHGHGPILCSCRAMAGTLEGSLAMFQGLPQSKSGRALWKALPAASSCSGAPAHTKITV